MCTGFINRDFKKKLFIRNTSTLTYFEDVSISATNNNDNIEVKYSLTENGKYYSSLSLPNINYSGQTGDNISFWRKISIIGNISHQNIINISHNIIASFNIYSVAILGIIDTISQVNYSFNFDTRQLILSIPNKTPFISNEFEVIIYEEDWSTVSSDIGYVEIINQKNIGSLPIITLTIDSIYSNSPTLRIRNGNTIKDISLGILIDTSNSPIIINSNSRITTKNNMIFISSSYPKIGTNEFFSVEFINNNVRTAIPISVYYKSYNEEFQRLNFRGNVTLQNILNQIDLPKKYYNSPTREKYTISEEVKIDFSRNMMVDDIDQIVNSDKTYRIELIGINKNGTQKIYTIGNINFSDLSVDIPEDGLVTDKFTGSGGVWL